jgi:hypothetical protein
MQIQSLRLEIRAFVPIDAKPTQAVQNALNQLRAIALDVRVLDTQNHRAATPAREQPIEKRGASASHVQIARRRRREPHANLTGRISRSARIRRHAFCQPFS